VDELETARVNALRARGHWGTARYGQALAFDDARHMAFLSEVCSGCKEGYTALAQEPNGNDAGFYMRNGWFEAVDAEVLYSVVRHYRPQRMIEVGSGFSTRVTRKAIADGGLSTKITCIDPSPRASVQVSADEYIASPVEAVSVSDIAGRLAENDVLFIDSSHKVVAGGDVPFLFLEVLPLLQRGVLIHIHDIFFPYEYPEAVVDLRYGWAEQYLVHAFLAYNEAFEVLWPGSYMWARHKQEILKYIPVPWMKIEPCSLWLRKVK
jgi:predicted O-methyltransferase YrrM